MESAIRMSIAAITFTRVNLATFRYCVRLMCGDTRLHSATSSLNGNHYYITGFNLRSLIWLHKPTPRSQDCINIITILSVTSYLNICTAYHMCHPIEYYHMHEVTMDAVSMGNRLFLILLLARIYIYIYVCVCVCVCVCECVCVFSRKPRLR
jgi:hypothetical protein